MKTYKIIVNTEAILDLDSISTYVAGLYRPESGYKYVNRILGQLASLSYTADIYPFSRYAIAKTIHPKAKTDIDYQQQVDCGLSHGWKLCFCGSYYTLKNDD